MIVLKFGGSSVADAACMREVAALVAQFNEKQAELEATFARKSQQLEAEKNRAAKALLQQEEELSIRFHKLERALRHELNLAKIQHAGQHDEKLRKLAEERAALQKAYESKLRELEARYRKNNPAA